MRGYPIVWIACVLGFDLIACRRTKPPSAEEEVEPPAEMEPPELGQRGTAECSSVPGRAFTIAGMAGRIEAGSAAPIARGFAVSALVQGSPSEARVFVRTDTTRDVSLGPIHGGAEPPQIAVDPSSIFLAWVDQDAGGPMVVVALVTNEPLGPKVRARKEIETKARPADSVEVRALDQKVAVVWDSLGSAKSGPSGVYCAVRDAGTLEPRGPVRRLSSPGEDASRPRLIARPNGYWVLWATSVPRSPDVSEEAPLGLVAAPPEKLRLRPLDSDCVPRAESIDVTAPEEDLVFDVTAHDDALWVLSKGDRSPDCELRVVTASGAVLSKGPLPEIGPDFPRLLSNEHGAWMLGRARDGAALLGSLTLEGALTLRPEPSLLGSELLGVTGEGLVIERRDGTTAEGSVPIDVISCATGAASPK